MQSGKSILYSVVIPVFNSDNIVTKTVLKVQEFFTQNNLNYEIILVNDGSSDGSWGVISSLAHEYESVVAINLLKNYGQHNANLCGFRESKGDYIITMDDDLQNPPEEISKLIQSVGSDYDLVIGRFKSKKHSFIRRLGSKLVGALNRKVFNVEAGLILTNFRIIRRDVIDRVCNDSSPLPYIPGLVLKYSGKRRNVLVQHKERTVGESNYNWKKILKLVAVILFNHSTIPLRLSALLGFIVARSSLLLSFYYLIQAVLFGTQVAGWASVVIMMSFLNGVIILLVSVIGEYLVRLLHEVGSNSSYDVSDIIRK